MAFGLRLDASTRNAVANATFICESGPRAEFSEMMMRTILAMAVAGFLAFGTTACSENTGKGAAIGAGVGAGAGLLTGNFLGKTAAGAAAGAAGGFIYDKVKDND